MGLRQENLKIVGKLCVIALGMFAFGYALVPIYRHICDALGINVLAVSETRIPGAAKLPANTQVDTSRTITVEFDTNVRGPMGLQARGALAAGPSG
jgi:cytochrome c oxidase assembly protein subunit 11